MEYTANEVAVIELVSNNADARNVQELDELQLALVGGGSVTVIFG
jgi:hypothetical protein